NGSPFDLFLLRNDLPRKPKPTETPEKFSKRLLAAVDALESPLFVADVDGPFAFHAHPFVFDAEGLEGLKRFLGTRPEHPNSAQSQSGATGIGNCAACHPAPDFTVFSFHNAGVSQNQYDDVHGGGALASLKIPPRQERNEDPNSPP